MLPKFVINGRGAYLLSKSRWTPATPGGGSTARLPPPPDLVARTAESADQVGRADPRDGNAVRDPATKVKGDECFTLAVPDPDAGA